MDTYDLIVFKDIHDIWELFGALAISSKRRLSKLRLIPSEISQTSLNFFLNDAKVTFLDSGVYLHFIFSIFLKRGTYGSEILKGYSSGK